MLWKSLLLLWKLVLFVQLLPRLTSWAAEERLASLRSVTALLSISGAQLLKQLPQLLLQLYGSCTAVDGGPPAPRQQQQQVSPLLLLVQHAMLRELNSSSDISGSSRSGEPWHSRGLQELGACSSLCCSLEAVELSLCCAGHVALLLPPCAWLPVIAVHLGLQHEARLYVHRKEAALAAAAAEGAREQEPRSGPAASLAERDFLQRFPGGYNSVVQTLGLGTANARRQQPGAAAAATAGVSVAITGNLCSSEAKKQALLLLARLLRGLSVHQKHCEPAAQLQQQRREERAMGKFRGPYGLGEEELWLLVRVIEHVQAGGSSRGMLTASVPTEATADDSDELIPYIAAPLLQLVLSAGGLCRFEARKLFAASLLQQVDVRSHPEIAKAAVCPIRLLAKVDHAAA